MKEQKTQEKVEANEGQQRSVSFSRHHCKLLQHVCYNVHYKACNNIIHCAHIAFWDCSFGSGIGCLSVGLCA